MLVNSWLTVVTPKQNLYHFCTRFYSITGRKRLSGGFQKNRRHPATETAWHFKENQGWWRKVILHISSHKFPSWNFGFGTCSSIPAKLGFVYASIVIFGACQLLQLVSSRLHSRISSSIRQGQGFEMQMFQGFPQIYNLSRLGIFQGPPAQCHPLMQERRPYYGY